MKRSYWIHFSVFSAEIAASLIVMHLALLLSFDKWVFIGAAIGIEVISVTLLIVLRKRKPQIWFPLINALATGLALAGFYVHFGLTPIIWRSSAIFGAAVAAYLIYGAILAIPAFDRHRNLTAVVFLLLTAASIVIGGVLTMDMVFALSAFIWLYLVSYSIFYIFPQENEQPLKYPVYASFIAAALIIFIVLIVVTEGDAVNGFAPDAPSRKKKNK